VDLRAVALILFQTFCLSAYADTLLKATDISGSVLDDVGSRRMVQPVESFTPEDFHPVDRTNLPDLLNVLPGIQSRTQGGPTISLRGSQSSARMLVLENGVPLNFADGTGFNPLYLTPENIGAVNVVKGPSSALFGHDAAAGVIEFQTEKLKTQKAFLSYGSFNTTQAFAGTPLTKKESPTQAQLTVYQSHTDGNYPFTIPRLGLTDTRSHNDIETVHMSLEARNELDQNFQWNTFNLFTRQIGSTPAPVTFPSFINSVNTWGLLSGVNFKYFPDSSSGEWAVGSRTTYKYLWQDYVSPANGFAEQPSEIWGVRQGLSITKKFGVHSLEIFDDFDGEKFSASYLASQQTISLNEFGASGFIALNDQQSLQPAIRISNEGGSVLPTIGLIGLTNDQWKYFAVYSQGYRPPSITDLYAVFSNYVANPSLLPETTDELDLGFEKDFQNFFVHFDAFARDTSNLIQDVQNASNQTTPININRARATGFEISAEHKSYVKTRVDLSYLNNRNVDTGDPIPLSPDMQLVVSIKKDFFAEKLSAQIQDTFWSTYDDESGGSFTGLGPWNTTDLFASYAFNSSIRAQASILNIFNQPRELALNYPEPQRSLNVTLFGYF